MIIYDIFFFIFSIIYLPYLAIKGKAHRDFMERFGRFPDTLKEAGKTHPIWIHAVSVGEVLAVKNLINEFSVSFPNHKIIISTTTRTGNGVARKILKREIPKFYFPLDFSFVVKNVLNILKPSVVVIMETEIWPNLISELSKRKIPVIIVNGRISDRSFKGYKKIKFIFKKILKKINLFCMQTQIDAERIKALGAPQENVKVTGNMKFDIKDTLKSTPYIPDKRKLGINESEPLIIAGSTHNGEEEIILKAYAKLINKVKNIRMLIAPRHIDQADNIKKLSEHNGFRGVFLSQLKEKHENASSEKSIFILDTFGELSHLYSMATVVFMGGSLVKRGGHNIVEPAMFGKPVIFGPHMHNFRDMARLFLEDKAALLVKDEKELFKTLEELLADEKKRETLGRNAKELINKSRGATKRNLKEIGRLLLRSNHEG